MTVALAPADNRHRTVGTDLADVTTLDEALDQADLNWGLNLVPADNLTVTTDDGVTATSIPGMRMVMRDDNHTTLGVVGSRYTAIDNRSVFTIAEHIADAGGTFTEAGVLDHGRKVFMRLAVPETTVKLAGGQDLVKFNINMRAAHDGSGAVTGELEALRLVCTNGVTARIPGIPHSFAVSHTASSAVRMHEAAEIMDGATSYAKGFAAAAQHMLDTPMTDSEFHQFVDGLWPEPDRDAKRSHTVWQNRREALLRLFRFAETNDLGRGSTWAGYNAVAEYVDWFAPIRRTRGATDEAQVRARRQLDKANQQVKDRAFQLLGS